MGTNTQMAGRGLLAAAALAGLAVAGPAAAAATSLTAPGIRSFSPARGAAGTKATIAGPGLARVRAVRFRGVAAAFKARSAPAITAVVPAMPPAAGRVTVVTRAGTVRSRARFTVPRIALSWAAAPPGPAVTVTGTGFGAAESAGVFAGAADEAVAVTGPAGSFGPITDASIGVPQTYPGQVALHARGDAWYNTWGSRAYNGDIFATSDDSTGFGGKCNSNVVVNELAGAVPGALSLAYENCMTSFGAKATKGDYGDGRSWKTDGIISVSGTLYLFVARQQNGSGGWPNGFQPASNASIIASSDGGRTWSNGFGVHGAANGAAPRLAKGPDGTRTIQATFRGSSFAAAQFINYGQDDNPASAADGGNQYVYAISNDGYAYDGSSMILGRVPRSKIGKLAGAGWQFYTGQPGGDGKNPADWSGKASDAQPILTAAHQLSESSVQYIPGLRQYVMTDSYYPFARSWGYSSNGGGASQTTWIFYEAPHPWGPWTKFFSAPAAECYFTCTPGTSEQLGLYDPALVSKFTGMGGLSGVIFTSGDFSAHNQSRPDDQLLYMLHAFPVTFGKSGETIVDDAAALPAGSTDWQVRYNAEGCFDNTMHRSDVPGDSVSYTFTGTSISWVGSENSDQGIADVSIDGGTPRPADTYNRLQLTERVLFAASGLAYGQHTITIQVTAGKNASSSGTYQEIDAFIVGG